MTDQETSGVTKTFIPERDASCPDDEAVGYLHIDVDSACDPIEGGGYWVPVDDKELAEINHPPRGHVIQFPKEGREPRRVGDREVPDHVANWDYRGDD